MPAEFLPPAKTYKHINEIDPILDGLYAEFAQDFMQSAPKSFLSKPIKINHTESKYRSFCETFWHLISRTRYASSKDDRELEPKRAMRVHWVKPLLDHHPHKDITYFKYYWEARFWRHYFWDQDSDYVLILEEKKTAFFLITGYVVDIPKMREDLEKYLAEYLKNPS